ncbi:MAG: ArsR/SmtB family transcription factor [Christensenellales bacterium]
MDQCDKAVLQRSADLLKALAHPARLCIVKMLMDGRCQTVGAMELCLPLSQSGVSQHIARLKAAGIVSGTRNGNEICYSLTDERARAVVELLFGESQE